MVRGVGVVIMLAWISFFVLNRLVLNDEDILCVDVVDGKAAVEEKSFFVVSVDLFDALR